MQLKDAIAQGAGTIVNRSGTNTLQVMAVTALSPAPQLLAYELHVIAPDGTGLNQAAFTSPDIDSLEQYIKRSNNVRRTDDIDPEAWVIVP